MALPNQFGENDGGNHTPDGTDGLLAWCVRRIQNARDARDNKFKESWREYTRLWRGFYTEKDKNNDSERSKLIAPALQQAVEMTVAEMEEAVFNRSAWFDVSDDVADEDREDMIQIRDRLLEDFEIDGVPDEISKTFLLGAVYGTGIAKINVQRTTERVMKPGGDEAITRPRVQVTLEAIRPDEFLIDPSARSVDEAEFVAHEIVKPMWAVHKKQRIGTYSKPLVGPYNGERSDVDGTGRNTVDPYDYSCLITEYFGQVPGSLIPGSGEEGFVEAIVTIANESQVLRAVVSPFTMKDRPIVAYQHDTVPGEFWGRGVCEKGYNPQKALDAELRARIDALALISAPMIGVDMTKVPRNGDMRVRPGKTIFTRGRPSEALEPIAFGNPGILAHTFQQTSDLERMVQMGTGAMDSATPIGINSRNETASGMSQLQAGFIKRSKRTMQNLERHFLDPIVRKALWRYQQFDPARYPQDGKFVVNATMGIMAKEVENAQLINMLGFVPPDSPAHPILIQAIFENSASANKKELAMAIKAMTQPPDPKEQERQQMLQQVQDEIMLATAQKEKAIAEKEAALAKKALAETQLAMAKAQHTAIKADLEDDLVEIQAANAVTAAEKARVARSQVTASVYNNERKARAQESKGERRS